MWLATRTRRKALFCVWAVATALALFSLWEWRTYRQGPDIAGSGEQWPNNQPSEQNFYPDPTAVGLTSKTQMCEKYPDTGKIAVGIKTGATEATQRLLPLLTTALSCVQEIMVFSDLEQELYGIKLYDVLSRFDESYKKSNPEFELYRQQKDFKASGREDKISELSRMRAPAREDFGKGKTAPWALDKYKFVPEVEMAYELQPGM